MPNRKKDVNPGEMLEVQLIEPLSPRRGRPPAKPGEKSSRQLAVRIRDEDDAAVTRMKNLLRSEDDSAAIKAILKGLSERSDTEIIDFLMTKRQVTGGYAMDSMGKIPGGQWRECVPEGDGVKEIGMDVAVKLGCRLGDFIVEVDGDSMNSHNPDRDIRSGSWLVMRRGIASEGRVCLMQARLDDGGCVWTVKRHSPSQDDKGYHPERMTNGMGHDFPHPPNTVETSAYAVCIGIIAPV